MLHGQLLNRLLIAAGAVAAVALAAPGIDAARADAAQVTVVSPGGVPKTLSLEALAGSEDVHGRSYVLRGSSGESTQVISGFSLAALLEAAGADPFSFSYLEVQRPAGGSVLLSSDQARDEGTFPDGPPVVYATAAGTGFLRPSSSAGDLNAGDSFEAPQGVTIALRKGSPLRVRAEASTLETRPGEPVEFTAAAEGAGAGETFAYSWHFDDGGSAAGGSATHSFARRGSYDVVVGVTTPSDSTGASAVVRVQVGPPLQGPDRKGGGTSRDAKAPDHGAATGGGGGGGASRTPTSSLSPLHGRAEQKRQPRPAPTPQKAPRGELVSGELLSAITSPQSKPKASPAARRGNLDGEESGGSSLPKAALGLLFTAGLLGAGALTEARSLLR